MTPKDAPKRTEAHRGVPRIHYLSPDTKCIWHRENSQQTERTFIECNEQIKKNYRLDITLDLNSQTHKLKVTTLVLYFMN